MDEFMDIEHLKYPEITYADDVEYITKLGAFFRENSGEEKVGQKTSVVYHACVMIMYKYWYMLPMVKDIHNIYNLPNRTILVPPKNDIDNYDIILTDEKGNPIFRVSEKAIPALKEIVLYNGFFLFFVRISDYDLLKETVANRVIVYFLTNWLNAVLPRDTTMYGWNEADSERAKNYRYMKVFLDRRAAIYKQAASDGAKIIDHIQDSRVSKFNLFHLWQMDQLKDHKKYMEFIYELAKSKSTSKNTGNTPLVDALIDFYELADLLNPEKAKKANRKLSDEEYVITAIMLCEMERCAHFHLFAMIAKHYTDVERPERRMTAELFVNSNATSDSRWVFPYDVFYIFWGRFTENKENFINNALCDFTDYQSEVGILFDGTKISHGRMNRKKPWNGYMLKKSRHIATDLYNVAAKHLPFDKLPQWSKEDYHFARRFFEQEYPVYKIYEQFCGDNPSPYDALLDTKVIKDKNSYRRKRTIDYIRELILAIGDGRENNESSSYEQETQS